jgi:hypothetical protein
VTGAEFHALLDKRDEARESHESYCASVNEEGAWGVVNSRAAGRLHTAYLELQEQVDAELEAERAAESWCAHYESLVAQQEQHAPAARARLVALASRGRQ